MILLFFALLVLFSSGSLELVEAAGDRLTLGESILRNQTLVSTGTTFALGFFAPARSNQWYVGIWYNNIPEKTVVWVANRENPATNTFAALMIGNDGNIMLSNDDAGSILWSSNASIASNSTVAVLLDSGNLELHRADGMRIWQSFDHPTDTYLPEMNMWMNFENRTAERFTAWKDQQDPSPGRYSFGFDPDTLLGFKIWNGATTIWRDFLWIKEPFSTFYSYNSTSLAIMTVKASGQSDIIMFYTPVEASKLFRVVLDSAGILRMLFWSQESRKWIQFQSSLDIDPCFSNYNPCGPYGLCSVIGTKTQCSCLKGFVPRFQKDWGAGKFSGGCIRKIPINCYEREVKFFKVERIKLPDHMMLIRNASETQCLSECTDRCNCTAYHFANISSAVSSTRCLIWVVDLLDLEQNADFLIDLNVRLDESEIASSTEIHDSSAKKRFLVIILTVLTVIILFAGTIGYCLMRRRKQYGNLKLEVVSLGHERIPGMLRNEKSITEPPLIDFKRIVAATDNFSLANKLGEGGFGPVYKGKLLQRQEIAVKRLSKTSKQGFEEFKNEVELIAKLQHTNLVKLLGWCMHEDERILVYEYLSNKSLDKYIFDPEQSSKLDWGTRFRIVEGIAQGILYLHRYSRLRIIHRDLKTSNILLDDAMNPKISDFGLARIFEGNQTEANTKRVAGTYGYMSPEYALNGLFSEKSDVFSFGVILLEIMTGKRSTGFYSYVKSSSLLDYVWQLWDEGRGLELAEPSNDGPFSVSEFMKWIQVGLLCTQERAVDRPTMASVVSMLSNDNSTLTLPKKPAFAIGRDGRDAMLVAENPFFCNIMDTVNGLTMSTTNGR